MTNKSKTRAATAHAEIKKSAKLPVPPRKPVGEDVGFVMIADPKKEGIPLELQTQNRRPSATPLTDMIAQKSETNTPKPNWNLPKTVTPEALQIIEQREAIKKLKARARVSKMLAKKNGETAKMPLEGKAALAAIKAADKALKEEERLAQIAQKAVASGHPIKKIEPGARTLSKAPASPPTDRSPGMKRLRESGKGAEIAKQHVAESKKATAVKPAKTKTTKSKPAKTNKNGERVASWYKEADGNRAVQMMKRKNGATSSEMQTELKWKAITVRRFVRDVVRNKLKLRTITDRSGGETRYTITT